MIVIANACENLWNKLKKEYKDVMEDAKRYMGNELDGFVYHHLDFSRDNMLPTLSYTGNRSDQATWLSLVIDYSKLTSKEARRAFILKHFSDENRDGRKHLDKIDIEEIGVDLANDKILLDEEMENVALIPKEFHSYLHNSPNEKYNRALNRIELYQQFLRYKESIDVKKLIAECEKAGGSVSGEIKAIEKMAKYVFHEKGKQTALDLVDLSYNALINYLRGKTGN